MEMSMDVTGLPRPDWQTADGRVVLYNRDCMEVLPGLGKVDAVVTDPPYGISYASSKSGHHGGTALAGIVGDSDTSLRDQVLEWWGDRTAIVFGTWKRQRPDLCKLVLTWEKGDHVGMGDLSIPWKPNTEEIYVLGRDFSGHRGSSVLRYNAPVSWNSTSFGRTHPHEKPIELMEELIVKTLGESIFDPFMGSGTTGVACVRLGRNFIGCEIDQAHFATAVRRIEAELTRAPLFEPPPIIQRSLIED
jgi:DNA modification methylase